MSLHDVDKERDRRIEPRPNQNDQQNQRMAHNTTQTTYKKESPTVTKQRLVHKNALILTYDSEGRVSSVYGYIPALSTTPVLIIAKAGYDVFDDILGIAAPTV